MGKPTVHDIAREAGVSLATVDRVLNARPGVREKTAARVHTAIEKLGYVRDIYAANLARQRNYNFVFILPDGQSQFLHSMRDAIAEARVGLLADRSDIRTITVQLRDPAAMIRTMHRIEHARVDGVAILASETPMVRDMIAHFKERGISVVALVTDQPNSERDHFVGIDNLAAGRTAGHLMGRFARRPGRVAVVLNTTQARDMVDRRLGFDEVLTRDFPHLVALPSLEGRDDHERTAQVLNACLDSVGDVSGIYCVGAGMRGVTQVVAARGLTGKVTVVGHDLTPHTRAALEAGTVDVIINQNTGHLVRSAARVLRARCDGAPVIASQEKIRIEIVLKENLP
ncbi:LacI family DNA-binding transcriptional regulator [Ovoidimarina sediminis]|uniref:LacI family DNA-binding transcriptional regulator n=1 Tax=Ovoidimarina sediminis TaxID=3079856 RepID=UPI00290EDA7F|nr:LacI family DNA-binding transcriptional regulator [Rhodophyticola sp. MJ-SS7]MDU8942028.1 LacI family DNA-binding transcriptional regulator [Rhodophyticola sp. MJ-SS7]